MLKQSHISSGDDAYAKDRSIDHSGGELGKQRLGGIQRYNNPVLGLRQLVGHLGQKRGLAASAGTVDQEGVAERILALEHGDDLVRCHIVSLDKCLRPYAVV